MLKRLTILNGELSVKFDPLNTRYTVHTDSSVEKLEIEYEIEENDQISIFNNQINDDQNEIVITVYNDEESMSYYSTQTTLKEDNIKYLESLELNKDETVPAYVAPTIAGVCFLIILFFFIILFKKRKKY